MLAPKVVNFSEISDDVVFIDEPDGYAVELSKADYFTIVVGVLHNSKLADFQHPNIVAKVDRVFEFKHERRNGSKFWTSKAGREFYFVVPRHRIGLVFKKGYSWVPVMIGGEEFHLNVSGGTFGNGWRDFVRSGPFTVSVERSKKRLLAVANAAVDPQLAEPKALIVDVRKDEHPESFRYKMAEQAGFRNLQPGHSLYLASGYSLSNGNGPYSILSVFPEKRKLSFADVTTYRASPKHVDWLKTYEANSLPVQQPVFWVHPLVKDPANFS